MDESSCASRLNIADKVNYLPFEIVELILYYADADTVISAAKTCSAWKNLVRASKKITQVWKRSCRREIPDNFCKDIVNNLYPKHFMDGKAVDWELVYMAWKKWLQIESFDCYRHQFSDVINEFSSIQITGCWILIIYHNDGRILAKNINGGKQILLLNKTVNICSVSLVCDVEPEYLGDEDGEDLLAGAAHDKAIVCLDMSADVIINLRTGRKSFISSMGTTEDLRYFEQYRVHLTRTPNSVNIACTDLYNPEQVVKKRFISTNIFIHDIWNEKILLCANNEWIVDNMKLEKLPSAECLNASIEKEYPNIWFYHNHIFKYCKIIIEIQAKGLLIKIIDEGEAFLPLFICPVISVRVRPTCAVFHAGILLIGCDQGFVYGYRVGGPCELLRLELDKPCWAYTDLPDSVQSLSVQEAPTGPVIWASTSSSIQRLTFTSPN